MKTKKAEELQGQFYLQKMKNFRGQCSHLLYALFEHKISTDIRIYLYYCAYRNSVNNAFLRLFRYVRNDSTMTIKI